MNFRNQARVWEAEQQHYEEEKKMAERRAEYQAEQEYLKTLALMSKEDQEKQRQRQSVAFLYARPPGYDASLERQEAAHRPGHKGAAPNAKEGQQGPKGGGNRLAKVLEGFRATSHERLELTRKGMIGLGRVEPSGDAQSGSTGAPAHGLVLPELDSDEEERAFRLAAMSTEERQAFLNEERRREKAAARQRDREELERAKAVLRAAGIAIPEDAGREDPSSSDEDRSSSASEQRPKRHKSSRAKRKKSKHKRSREGKSKTNRRDKSRERAAR
ncbi:hypothetical protein QBZ16_003437 [Prototheca wickerhamii]|uniref:CBF1-interacting co-repressor CIR N-terminal domain-containing protein n=1 Tax=Prototheca wickerhamii TaxID=3111 RepID=A0AAD9IMA7_PROWI|nr:hypothetical protein QBZ16_003437 [Prototheca wickerhamii]